MEKRIFESFQLIDCECVACRQYANTAHVSVFAWDCYYSNGNVISKPVKVRLNTYEPDPIEIGDAAKHVPQSFTGFTNGTGFLYIIEEIKPVQAPAHYRVVNRISIKEPYPVQDNTIA